MVGLLDFFTGGDPEQMAQIDPRYGVPRSDVRSAAINTLGNVSALLLAAGQPIMPSQRAQLLAQLGPAAAGAQGDIYNAAQRRLMTAQLDQRRAEAEETRRIGELMQDPAAFRAATGFELSQFGGMRPGDVSQAMRQIRVARLSNPLQEEAQRAQIARDVAAGRLTEAQAAAAEEALQQERRAGEAFRQMFPGLLGPVPAAAPPAAQSGAVPGATAPGAPAVPTPSAAQAPSPSGVPAPGGTQTTAAQPRPDRPPNWVLTPEQERLLAATARTPQQWIEANERERQRRSTAEGERFTRENALRDEFERRSIPFAQRQTAFQAMTDLARQGEGASDMALVLSLMKVYDPTSTVTGTEAATAQNAAGVPSSLIAQYNRLIGGGSLDTTARNQLVNAARQRFFAEMDDFASQLERYTGLANRYGLNVENIVQDFRNPDFVRERDAIRERRDLSRQMTPDIIGRATLEQLDRIDVNALNRDALQAYQQRRAELARTAAPPAPAVNTPGTAAGINPAVATELSRRLTPEAISRATPEMLARIDTSVLSEPALQAYQRRVEQLQRAAGAPAAGVR